jgi:hypothetical protein
VERIIIVLIVLILIGEAMEVIPSNVYKPEPKPIIPKQQPSRKQQETTRTPPNKVLFIQVCNS